MLKKINNQIFKKKLIKIIYCLLQVRFKLTISLTVLPGIILFSFIKQPYVPQKNLHFTINTDAKQVLITSQVNFTIAYSR